MSPRDSQRSPLRICHAYLSFWAHHVPPSPRFHGGPGPNISIFRFPTFCMFLFPALRILLAKHKTRSFEGRDFNIGQSRFPRRPFPHPDSWRNKDETFDRSYQIELRNSATHQNVTLSTFRGFSMRAVQITVGIGYKTIEVNEFV